MSPAVLLGGLTCVVGLVAVAGGLLSRTRQRDRELAELLSIPFGEQGVDLPRVAREHGTVVTGTLGLANRVLDRWDERGSLRDRIDAADLSLRPAELVVISLAAGLAVGALGAVATDSILAVVPCVLLVPFGVEILLRVRTRRRTARIAAQLPDALDLIASSLSAGQTFLRSIQLMTEELGGPLSDELRRVVAETQLGSPLISSLERMSQRIHLRDVDWLVQAIRIQQTVGSQLAELLVTLSEMMREREDLRREVRVLTAEGRISGWVLGALPVLLFIAVQVVNPGYLDPMLQGWGLVWLGLTGVAMAVGIWLIMRMVAAVDR